MRALLLLLAAAALHTRASAQAGDVQGEDQPPLPASLVVPPAPARTPEEELATFRLPDDLAIEVVAAEPLVRDPVQAVFDARGRLWVVEMRGYMPDVDGRGEREPNGSIAILTDTDGDGRMDARTTFLDGLVLPRSVAITRGGALVIAPPHLLFAVDEDDDGVADDVTIVDKGLDGITSPEYGINGLLPVFDGAFACANASWRYVFEGGQWKRQRTAGGGQWGIGKDDWGRVYYAFNSDPLRADAVPSHLAVRNPSAGAAWGTHRRVVDDMTMNPARVNPGVNRAYRKGTLDAEFKLDVATGTCGPWVVRGDALPEPYRGDALVCEPCGNLIVRYDLADQANGEVKGKPVRNADGLDFLTSTDERFRPVNLCDGPDGALIVVDIYRGLLQHRMFVTTYLRKQVEARGLAAPIGLGRIWRIRAKGAERKKPADLTALAPKELAAALASPNGWTRDTAQRLLVESPGLDRDARAVIEKLLFEHADARARIHALWVLAEKNAIDAALVLRVLQSTDERVLVHGLRVCARTPPLAVAEGVRARAVEIARKSPQLVRPETVDVLAASVASSAPREIAVITAWNASNAGFRARVLSAVPGREVELLEEMMQGWDAADWGQTAEGRRELFTELGRALANDGRAERIDRALEAFDRPGQNEAHRAAFLEGLAAGIPVLEGGKPGQWIVDRELAALRPLLAHADAGVAKAARSLEEHLAWPGKPGFEALVPRPLTDVERARFVQGRELYATNCAACHQTSGRGDPSLAPALRGSPWVLGGENRIARIVLHGLGGPIEVLGQRFESEMPAFAASDADLAAILTYVRREWGNTAEPVTAETIARARAAEAARKTAWTADELAKRGD